MPTNDLPRVVRVGRFLVEVARWAPFGSRKIAADANRLIKSGRMTAESLVWSELPAEEVRDDEPSA